MVLQVVPMPGHHSCGSAPQSLPAAQEEALTRGLAGLLLIAEGAGGQGSVPW